MKAYSPSDIVSSQRSPPHVVSSPDSQHHQLHQHHQREGPSVSPLSPAASYASSRSSMSHDAPMHKTTPTSLQVPTLHPQLPQMMPTEKNIYKSQLEQNYKKSPPEQFLPSSNGHKRESSPPENGMDLTSYKQKRRESEKFNEVKEPEEPAHKMENGYVNGNKMAAAASLDEGLVRDVSLNSVMVQSSEGMRYKCTVCSMLLKSKECLALHVNAKHTQVSGCSKINWHIPNVEKQWKKHRSLLKIHMLYFNVWNVSDVMINHVSWFWTTPKNRKLIINTACPVKLVVREKHDATISYQWKYNIPTALFE